MAGLSESQVERYSRQLILPEVGGKGQEKLLRGRVLVVGAGGLGSPAAYYLAAAGVGTIGLVDSDSVDLSNLQRQILHASEDVGRPKTESAAEKLRALNPDVTVNTYQTRLGVENVREIIKDYDIVVDAVDNFAARYLLNDACVMEGKPMVEAGVLRFDGLLMTILPGEGPCYRCAFPDPPPPGAVPSCQEAGVIGVAPGVMGVLQANEVIKLLLGVGRPLAGRILTFNALNCEFQEIEWKKNPDCPVCGDHPTIRELSEYHLACEVRGD